MHNIKHIRNLPGSQSVIIPFYRAADYDTHVIRLLAKLNQAYDDTLDDVIS